MTWLDPMFGQVSSSGANVELRGRLNFTGGLQAVVNDADAQIDISISPANAPTGAGVTRGDTWTWTGTAWILMRGVVYFDVDYTGAVDATDKITAQLAAAQPGDTFRFGRGIVRVGTSSGSANLFTIPLGVAVEGAFAGMGCGPYLFGTTAPHGTEIRVYGTGRLFSLNAGCALRGLVIHYPNQQMNAAPDVYGETVYIGANAHWCKVENVLAINPYHFIRVTGGNGVTITNCNGQPLRYGIVLNRCADVARVTGCHFNPVFGAAIFGATLKTWVQNNLDPFVIDGPEEFCFVGCFAYGCKNGYVFRAEGTVFRGVYGSIIGGGIDIATDACIRVEEPNGLTLRGLHLSNVHLVPASGAYGIRFTDTNVPANADQHPAIYGTNVSFHNAMARAVKCESGSYGVVLLKHVPVRGFTSTPFYAGGNSVIHVDRPIGTGLLGETADSGTCEIANQIDLGA